MCDAVSRNDFETAKQLVDDDERRFDQFWTFLMQACSERKKAIVDFLLNSGVAVDKTNPSGLTALMFAAISGDEDIFELLLKHNADVMKKDRWGWTVFHVAAKWNRKNILNRLLLLMVDEHCSSASSSPTRTASFMLTVDIEDNRGCTPLWYAAFNGHVDCVDVLLIHGANSDHKDKEGKSPRDIAKQKGHTAVVNKLSESIRWHSNPILAMKDRVIFAQKRKIESLEKKNGDQSSEIVALNAKIRKLESIIEQDFSGCDPEDLYKAVICRGCDQWFSICMEMGYSAATVMAFTNGMPSEADKIRAVFETKKGAVGERDAVKALLKACKRIPKPIIGGVMDNLRAVAK
jgi:ankyrin repeat protein